MTSTVPPVVTYDAPLPLHFEAPAVSPTGPTHLIAGDADLFRPESMVDLFRLLGGARPDGGMAGLPASQLAILPGATHFGILYRTDLLLPIIVPFLES